MAPTTLPHTADVKDAEKSPREILHSHSNQNLLKIDTNDRYSTISVIKKKIIKDLSFSPDIHPLFPGLQRINKNPKNPCVYMAFDTAEHRRDAMQQLQTISARGAQWKEVQVLESDLLVTHKGGSGSGGDQQRKRKRDGNDDEGEAEEEEEERKEGGGGGEITTTKKKMKKDIYVSPKVAQFAHLPPSEQLDRKKKHCLSVMKRILPSHVYGWDTYAKRFDGIRESPQWVGYRNHVQLSFGYTGDGTPGLGFWAGAMVDGFSTVISLVNETSEEKEEDPPEVVTTHPLARAIAAEMLGIVKEFGRHQQQGDHDVKREKESEEEEGGGARAPPPPHPPSLSVFDKRTGEGFWRKVQIRHNIYGEVLIDIEIDTGGVPDTLLTLVKRRLVAVLTGPALTEKLRVIMMSDQQQESPSSSSSPPQPGVVSLQYHAHSGIRSLPPDTPRVVLAGSPYLTEYVNGLSFNLGPSTFFQVNTPAMVKMLDGVVASAGLDPSRTTLLDLCSGVGTIGICLARHVRKVIGIELVPESVERARENVKRNGIANAVFHAGRVEELLPKVISGLTPEERGDIVAVLDPPRAGVVSVVLKWVRGTPTIRTAIYISCEQKALERDCPLLTKPPTKAYRGVPFEVVRGFAVDMFPHTQHVEMVAVLRRREEDEEEVTKD